MVTRWIAIFVLFLLAGCGGPAPVGSGTQPIPPAVPSRSGNNVFAVKMRPQQPVPFPDKSVSIMRPTRATAALKANKGTSCVNTGWFKYGSAYENSLPLQHIDRDAVEEALGLYTPDTSSGIRAGMAYGLYAFDLSRFTGEQTIKLVWRDPFVPVSMADVYIGFGQLAQDKWDWYAGPADNVLTIPSYGPYRTADGTVLIAIAVIGTTEVHLERLEIGAPEERAAGADGLADIPAEVLPLLSSGGSLPSTVDLSAECSPVNDQGQWGACTCFAVADSAYNFELGRIYGPFGWDLSSSEHCMSPKYLYVKSGIDQGFPPGGGYGRWTDQVIGLLETGGVATEANAPYDFMYTTNFSPAAEADATVLRIDAWEEIPCNTLEGIASVKAVLANQRKPLVMQAYLDYGFFDILPGQVWEYFGPLAGGHAMAIVGYDDTQQAFKVRNSWSTDWGEDGYCWIGYFTFRNPEAGIRAWTLKDEFDPAVRDRFLPDSAKAAPVTNVNATDGSAASVTVSWAAYPAASSFNIYRDAQDAPVGSVPRNATSYLDDALADTFGHVYWVEPVLASGTVPLSSPDVGYKASAPLVMSVNPTAGTEGAVLEFTAAGMGSGPLTYSWNFGGAASPNTSADARPQVTLGAPGTYGANVTLTNALGNVSFPFTLEVKPVAPVIKAILHASGFSGQAANPTATLTGGGGASYSWDFGGGAAPNTSASATPSITLGAPGSYDGSLNVTSIGGSDVYNFKLTVLDAGNTQWRMPNGNGEISYQLPVTGPATPTVKWRFFAGGNPADPEAPESAPVFGSDGTLYFGTTTRGLFALNPDGTERWKYVADQGYSGTPLVLSDGGIVFASNQNVYCVEDDGSQRWTYPLLAGSAALYEASGGKVCLASGDKYLYTLNAQTGAEEQSPYQFADKFNTVSGITGDAAGIVYFGSKSGTFAYDTVNGVPKWIAWAPNSGITTGPILSPDGMSVYSIEDDLTLAYDSDEGCEVFFKRFNKGPFGRNHCFVTADGTVRVMTGNGGLHTVDPMTGDEVGSPVSVPTGTEFYAAPTVDLDGNIYITSADEPEVYCLAPDGSVRWTYDAGTRQKSALTLGPDGTLYFAGRLNGYLYAIGAGGDGQDRVPPYISAITPTDGEEGSVVSIVPTVLGDPPTSYAWDFGGGATPNTSAASSPTVTLATAGDYTFTVTVSNAQGVTTSQFSFNSHSAIQGWTSYDLGNFGTTTDWQAKTVSADTGPVVAVHSDSGGLHVFRASSQEPTSSAQWVNDTPVPGADAWGLDAATISGQPIIAYKDGTLQQIVYAAFSGSSWSSHPVEADQPVEPVSLAVVNGKPGLVYRKWAAGEVVPVYGRSIVPNPQGATDWLTMQISTTPDPGVPTGLIDISGRPMFVFGRRDAATSLQLGFAYATKVDPDVTGDWLDYQVVNDWTAGAMQLTVINLKPALLYTGFNGGEELRIVKAAQQIPTGPSEWGSYTALDSSGNLPQQVGCFTHAGLPAISFFVQRPTLGLALNTDPNGLSDWNMVNINPLWRYRSFGAWSTTGPYPAAAIIDTNNGALQYWYYIP